MKLYILRHADADPRDTEKFPDDMLRPLTDKGREQIKRVAGLLNRAKVKPDLILTSPAVRTMDTAKGMRKRLGIPKDKVVPIDALLPEGTRSQLITEITETYKVDALMIVGHEPNLSMLISFLVSGDETLAHSLEEGRIMLPDD